MGWVHPAGATFPQNCTLILDMYSVVSENETFLHRPFLPQESLSAPTKGHRNIYLPALNIQPRRTCLQLLQPFTSTLPALNIQWHTNRQQKNVCKQTANQPANSQMYIQCCGRPGCFRMVGGVTFALVVRSYFAYLFHVHAT